MSKTKKLAMSGMLAALYFALSFLTVQTGNLKFTFASLALVIAVPMLGPPACGVALVGEGLYQILLYPISATTPLWIIPPVLHTAALWLLFRLLCGKTSPEQHPMKCYLACLTSALINTAANTATLYFDSKIFGYYTKELVFGVAGIRTLVGLGTAALVTTAAIPLLRLLHKKQNGGIQ